MKQLRGSVLNKIKEIRQNIIHQIAFIESALDDPEHISMDNYEKELEIIVRKQKEELKKLLVSSENGKILKEGINTVILGKPNAGKSSLLKDVYKRQVLDLIK